MKLSLLPLLALVFSGCATVKYTEATSGDMSKVRFASKDKDIVVVRSYSNKSCDNEQEMMRLRGGFL